MNKLSILYNMHY